MANGIEGRGPPLIGTIQCKIGIDQYDLQKSQAENGPLNLVRSWFNDNTGKVNDKKINTEEFIKKEPNTMNTGLKGAPNGIVDYTGKWKVYTYKTIDSPS